MDQGRVRRGSARGYAAVGLALAVMSMAVLIAHPWTTLCPTDWSDAPRIALASSSADVTLDGRPFRVGGDAVLDYGLHGVTSPLDRLRASRHPLTVIATVAASSREALGDPAFTCVRATLGSEVWARRPTTYPTQTLADGYPPGAQPPAYNEAWRLAVLNDGPEWPDGEPIALELWLSVDGRHYIFTLPAFALMRGG